MKRALWATGLLAACLYAAMVYVLVTRILPDSIGQPLDFRVMGYRSGEVAAYLNSLGDEARAALLGPLRKLDTAFLLALASFLVLAVQALARGLSPLARLALALPAAGYALFDLWENATVARLIRAGLEGLDMHVARDASQLTVAKYALLLLAVAVAGVLLLRRQVARGAA